MRWHSYFFSEIQQWKMDISDNLLYSWQSCIDLLVLRDMFLDGIYVTRTRQFGGVSRIRYVSNTDTYRDGIYVQRSSSLVLVLSLPLSPLLAASSSLPLLAALTRSLAARAAPARCLCRSSSLLVPLQLARACSSAPPWPHTLTCHAPQRGGKGIRLRERRWMDKAEESWENLRYLCISCELFI